MQLKEPNDVGEKIKAFRLKHQWTQNTVADKLKISIPAYSKIETGITDVNMSRLVQIAKVFNVRVADIVNGVNETTPSDDLTPTIDNLEIKIAERDQQIADLRKKLIELYDEARSKK